MLHLKGIILGVTLFVVIHVLWLYVHSFTLNEVVWFTYWNALERFLLSVVSVLIALLSWFLYVLAKS